MLPAESERETSDYRIDGIEPQLARRPNTRDEVALLLASAPLLVSAVLPGRRAAWIDALHVILIGGLLGLWAATRWL